MQVRTIVLVLGVLCVGGLIGACTSSGQNSPPAGPNLTIANPLDMSAGLHHPCQLVRSDQLTQFHLVPPGAATGGGCTWSPNVAQLPGYWSGVAMGAGIAGLYQRRSAIAVFQPTTISGYPAVHTAATAADQRHGKCTVEIGVARDTLVDVSVTVPPSQSFDYTDPCDDVDSFAGAVIANAEGIAP